MLCCDTGQPEALEACGWPVSRMPCPRCERERVELVYWRRQNNGTVAGTRAPVTSELAALYVVRPEVDYVLQDDFEEMLRRVEELALSIYTGKILTCCPAPPYVVS